MNNEEKRSENFGAFYIWLDGEVFPKDNITFLESENIPLHRRIYVSRYSPTVIVLISEGQKNRISRRYELSPYNFERPEKMSDEIVLGQIRAGKISGTNAPPLSLTGEGIKIGMIAVENIIFDSLAKGLEQPFQEGRIIVYPSIIPPTIDRHPTCVLSEIIGSEVTADGVEFMGIVRDATVYFDALYSVKEVYESIERMLDEGVRIINFSAGLMHDGIRNEFDRQIDLLIENGDFLFVSAAGNFEKVASPAKAYNALTVGNLKTKSEAYTPEEEPFKIADSSAYFDILSLPHKPEISAPGEWIGFVDRNSDADFQNFGTSFATPLVTSVAGQLISVNSSLSYLSYKGILLMSADGEKVSSLDNPYIYENSFLRLKSGYGIVDALRAVDILNSAEIYEGTLNEGADVSGNFSEVFFIFELRNENEYPRLYIDGESVELNFQTSIYIKRQVGNVQISGNGDSRFSLICL